MFFEVKHYKGKNQTNLNLAAFINTKYIRKKLYKIAFKTK